MSPTTLSDQRKPVHEFLNLHHPTESDSNLVETQKFLFFLFRYSIWCIIGNIMYQNYQGDYRVCFIVKSSCYMEEIPGQHFLGPIWYTGCTVSCRLTTFVLPCQGKAPYERSNVAKCLSIKYLLLRKLWAFSCEEFSETLCWAVGKIL